MATTLNNTNEDLLFYDVLKAYVFDDITEEVDANNKWLVSHGILQIESMLEFAISKVSGVTRDSTVGRDFVDGSDAKKVTSNWRNNCVSRGEWTNSYIVTNIHQKQGTLRIMAYNRVMNRFDYYAIPYDAYSHLKSTVDITLDKFTGHYQEPTPTGCKTKTKWNLYKKSSFVEMATW